MPIYAYTTLDDPLGPLGTSAQGINTSGQIAGYYLDSSNSSHGFLYSGGTYTTLDDPLANAVAGGTAANGINGAGQIIGYYRDATFKYHGFLYSGGASGTYTTLPDDPSAGPLGIVPYGINASGQIVGYYFDGSGNEHGFSHLHHHRAPVDGP